MVYFEVFGFSCDSIFTPLKTPALFANAHNHPSSQRTICFSPVYSYLELGFCPEAHIREQNVFSESFWPFDFPVSSVHICCIFLVFKQSLSKVDIFTLLITTWQHPNWAYGSESPALAVESEIKPSSGFSRFSDPKLLTSPSYLCTAQSSSGITCSLSCLSEVTTLLSFLLYERRCFIDCNPFSQVLGKARKRQFPVTESQRVLVAWQSMTHEKHLWITGKGPDSHEDLDLERGYGEEEEFSI